MRKVLFVSYAFPPVGGAGVQRPSKFVKFLPRFGWEPWVLTAANPSVPLIDESLIADLPPEARIIRARTLEPSYKAKVEFSGRGPANDGLAARLRRWAAGTARSLLLPDVQTLWWPHALPALISTVRREKIDVIFASGPPFSSLVLAAMAGCVTRTPVVADFRDEWGFSRRNWENMTRHGLASRLDLVMERWVVSRCADFTAVTSTYVQAMHGRHPKAAAGKGQVITNGFDPDDFRDLAVPSKETGPLRIVYTGTVWAATSLRVFLRALAEARAAQEVQDVELVVVGRVVDEESAAFEDERLGDSVRLLGYRSHAEVVALMAGADVLLLTLSDLAGADRIIPGKVFEYVASRRRILALLPEGESRRLLRESGVPATILDPADVNGIKAALRTLADEPPESAPRDDTVERFSRLTLTRRLSETLASVVASGRGRTAPSGAAR